MIFWVGILVGVCFAYFTSKMGFYQTWAMVFNIVISIYVAIFLTPVVADAVPAATDTAYGYALILIAITIGTLVTLQGITYALFTGQFIPTFPRVFNTVGGGILGFLAGFLVWSFAALLVSTTPVSQSAFAQKIGLGSGVEQTNVSYISWWCNLVNTIAASQDNKCTPQEVIHTLLAGQKKKADEGVRQRESKKPAEPNSVQKRPAGEKQRSRSRNAGLEDI
jgi:xanthosine utilization system XapX-like protein